jgi:GntR family transcriptional repressor for pyruvate dehydrogenase complex
VIAISDEITGMFASLDAPDRFLEHDIRFHQAVAATSDNPILVSIVEMISTLFREFRRTSIGRARDLKQSAEEHRLIYQAIRARDPERARRAMDEHLRRSLRTQALEDANEASAEGTAAGNSHLAKEGA